MRSAIDLDILLSENSRIDYGNRIVALLKDCELLRECRKDYWTYNHYATMLEHAAFKLRRQAEHVKEDIKHGKR